MYLIIFFIFLIKSQFKMCKSFRKKDKILYSRKLFLRAEKSVKNKINAIPQNIKNRQSDIYLSVAKFM